MVVVHAEGEDQADQDGGPGGQQEQPQEDEGAGRDLPGLIPVSSSPCRDLAQHPL